MTLAEQLTEVYLTQEKWHDHKLSKEYADAYHQSRLDTGNIITVSDGEKLCGYCEFYVNRGICYIHNLFLYPEYRFGKAIRMIKRRLFEVSGSKIFIGERFKHDKTYGECQIRSSNGKG